MMQGVREPRTADRNLERGNLFFPLLFDALSEGVVVQDADGMVVKANRAAERILGMSREQLLGQAAVRPGWRCLREDGSPFPVEEDPARVTLRTGEPCRNVVMGVGVAGEDVRWIRIDAAPLPEGTLTSGRGVFSTFVDVTTEIETLRTLRVQEERWHLAVDGSDSGIWDWIDVGEDAQWWSPRFYELLGYQDGELEASATSFTQLLHPEDVDPTWAAARRHMEGGAPFNVQYRLRQKDGSYRWFLARASIKRDAGGAAQRMVGTITDVHERREAFLQVDRFFSLSVDLVCIADVESKFQRLSPSWMESLGYSQSELEGRVFLDLVHPDDTDRTLEAMSVLGEGQSVRAFENRYQHADGHWVWLSWNARADRQGTVYAVARDVTAERNDKEALARHAEELERTNEELEQFARAASHDLQEPLRTLSSYAELLSLQGADQLDEEGQEFLAYINEAADRMRGLIQALRAYTRVGREDVGRAEVQVVDLVRAALADLEVSMREAGAQVTVGDLPTVSVEPTLIRALFQNLIANAVKFRGDVAPEVHIDAARVGPDWRFDVADNGIGIPEEHRGRVFDVFKRLHGRERFEGTGMGLSICRKIVQQHGGKIWCEANPTGGTVFSFTLPASRVEQ